jgi:hypothetical protein
MWKSSNSRQINKIRDDLIIELGHISTFNNLYINYFNKYMRRWY